jgi:hypothetical protein
MRKEKFVLVFVLLALLLSAGSGRVMGQEPPTEQVPACVPPDQVPDEVNIADVSISIQVPPSESKADAEKPVPRQIPDDEVPDEVHKVEYTETVTISAPAATMGVAQPLGVVTLRFGFYWYQYTPDLVAVAGFAQTTADFCCNRLFARVKLYRDVEHTGDWEFMDIDQSEATGSCVTDSGEAKTHFWSARNGTDWKVKTEHLARWDGHTDTWNRQKVDSFP